VNVTKRDVLAELVECGDAGISSDELARRFRLTAKAAEVHLRRLHRFGLVELAREGRIFASSRFRITDRGRGRLDWYDGARRIRFVE